MGTAFADKVHLAATQAPRSCNEARRVPVAILDKPFGGADGLLGRSFLSRFDVVVGATRWTLKPRATDP